MIALLSGQLASKSADQVIVDVGGVGYRLWVPLSTFYALPEGGDVRLHVHTHVREDAIHLYGFLSAEEKEMFATLLGVSGIGPRVAIGILSHIPSSELCSALADGDVGRLSALPGIGKKTAERLVLELREKIARPEPAATSVSQPVQPAPRLARTEEALSALVNLGYKEAQARKVLKSMEPSQEASLEQILKAALKVLAK